MDSRARGQSGCHPHMVGVPRGERYRCLCLVSFKVLFSDSVAFMGRDSLGTLVTARSTQTNTRAFPVCADSVMLTGLRQANVADTSGGKMVLIGTVPLEKALSAGTGSGYYTLVAPGIPPLFTSIYGDGAISPQYMRVRYQPSVRTGAPGLAGVKTRGIKGLRMEALVIYKNR
jgi:hypothetical protein